MNGFTWIPISRAVVGSVVLLLIIGACGTPGPVVAPSGAGGPTAGTVTESSPGALPPGAVGAITVTGDGRVLVTPDLARVTLGVEVRNPSLAVALSEAATRLEAVIGQLKKSGVQDRDIRTVRFDVQPVQRLDEPTRRPVADGFLVTNLLQVTFREITSLGPRLDAVLAGGATTVQAISFDVADPAAATRQAREAAMVDAAARAGQLAKLAGVTLGSPLSISEELGGGVRPLPVGSVAEAQPGAGAPVTPIEPGQTEVRVSVRVQYALR